jgi:hypothetical protein
MDFEPSEEQRAIVALARDFAAEQMAPHASRWDQDKIFPADTLRAAAKLGFAAIYTGEEFGGTGLERIEAAMIFEELSVACASTAAYISIHNMACWMVDRFGDAALRRRLLPDMTAMAKFASYCLTEPGAGSDAASLGTRAVLAGAHYVLNGTKAFISGAGASDVYVVMARTGGPGPKGISAFVVEKGFKGLSFGKLENKLGWNSQPTAMVVLEDCEVPTGNRLGAEGEGFKIAMQGLDGGRVNIGACSIGAARASMAAALGHLKVRKQFGRALAEFQALQFRLADMATSLDAARLMVHRAASAIDAKSPDAAYACAMAKRFATDAGHAVCDDALQLFGGYGYLKDYPIERHLRDTRVHRILEGTNEIMRVLIARKLLAD